MLARAESVRHRFRPKNRNPGLAEELRFQMAEQVTSAATTSVDANCGRRGRIVGVNRLKGLPGSTHYHVGTVHGIRCAVTGDTWNMTGLQSLGLSSNDPA